MAAGKRHILNIRAAVDAMAGLALTRQLMQDDDAATAALDLLREYGEEHNDPVYLSIADSFKARLALLRGELDWALQWACSFDAMPIAVPICLRACRRTTDARGGAHLVKQPLIEALTNRKHDVLMLLSQRFYDKEIAP